MFETTKTSLTSDEFDTSSGTLTQIWPKKVDRKVVGIVEKSFIGSNVTRKYRNLKTRWLQLEDTAKELSEWR